MYKRAVLWLAPLLALTLYTHLVGLNRGSSDFVPVGRQQSTAFYNFHPDEETLIRAALDFTDPLAPPLTPYGTLSLYLLKFALIGHAPVDLNTPQDAALIFIKARALSALISFSSLVLLWYIGCRWWTPQPTALAVLLFAMTPLAIQQAHFYTVDGLFTLCSLATLYTILRATGSNTWHSYALVGLLIGCTGAVRLNGLLLGFILLLGHFTHTRDLLSNKRAPFKLPALAALIAILSLVAWQPYLVSNPDLIWRADSHADFAFSFGIARGTALQTWTLIDVHTLPYVHYLTTLLPQAVGWPLTLATLAGLLHIAWRGDREPRLLLLWVVLCFLIVGGLHTKPIRYLFPLLPFLMLFFADLCYKLQPRLGLALAVVVALSTTAYGLAFAHIYTSEDSRIQAARWLAKHAPANAVIGLEKGAFTLHKLIDGTRTGDLNILTLFYTGPYMLCGQRADYLHQRTQRFEHIALIDVNRYRQFTAVPERYPVAASFYHQLTAGSLGYEQVARFKHYPVLFGIDYHDDHAEPSFLGYDHPTVLVFARRDNFDPAFAQWQRRIAQDPHCPDRALRNIADALNNNDLSRARRLVEDHLAISPTSQPIAQLLAAETYHRLDLPKLAEQARNTYTRPLVTSLRNSPTLHRIPAASAASLVELGLPDLALAMLAEGASESVFYPLGAMSDMADSYIAVAQRLLTNQHLDHMERVLELSTQLYEKPAAYNTLARSAYFYENYTRARAMWQRSLSLDPTQENIRQALNQLTTETAP